MPMERMCSCQLDEAPLEAPPQPIPEEYGFGVWQFLGMRGPQLGSKAAGSNSLESLECGKRHLAEDRGYCRMLQNTDKYKHEKRIPSDYDLPEIITTVTF